MSGANLAAAAAADGLIITEIFSNCDGAMQYIKLSTTSDNQHDLAERAVRSYDSAGVLLELYTFPTGLTNTQTENKLIIVVSVPFPATTQIHVDCRIPEDFIPIEGGEIRLNVIDTFTFVSAQLPRNGIQALGRTGTAMITNPINLAGQTISVAVAAPSMFHDNNGVVSLPLVAVAGEGVANASLLLTKDEPMELTLIDGYSYDAAIVSGALASRLEGSLLSIPSVRAGTELDEVKMSLLVSQAFIFGDLEVVSVRVAPVIAALPPAPAPAVETLALSIAAGKTQYNTQCASCHGNSGQGGAGPSLQGRSDVKFQALRSFINDRMPKFNEEACVDNATSSCATNIANYLVFAFQLSDTSASGSFGF